MLLLRALVVVVDVRPHLDPTVGLPSPAGPLLLLLSSYATVNDDICSQCMRTNTVKNGEKMTKYYNGQATTAAAVVLFCIRCLY